MHFFMKNKMKLVRIIGWFENRLKPQRLTKESGGVSCVSVKNVRKTEDSRNRDSTLDSSLMSVKKIYIVI